MNKNTILCLLIIFLSGLNACNYLDVVPDNVATLSNAFSDRTQARKYLFTCYSAIPRNGDLGDDAGMVGGDALWRFKGTSGYFAVAEGHQNVISPLGDRWGKYYNAIRDCNIFLDSIETVPDIMPTEKRRWIGEVKFLKAYYHFFLLKMYGPIPIMDEEIDIGASIQEVNVSRSPVDSCFNYIINLINEAIPNLPMEIDDPANELGRITKVIALSIKAKVLVFAASPLFNGNQEASFLKNPDGTALFDKESSKTKWDSAAAACRIAIEAANDAGFQLYQFNPAFDQAGMTDTIKQQMTIRNAICDNWNSGIIWANTQNTTGGLQSLITPFLDPGNLNTVAVHGQLSPPLHIASLFYSEHGVPIEEDKEWDYDKRYELKVAGVKDKLYIREGYSTARFNFDREPRFYATMGFDGGIWYGQGHYDDNKDKELFFIEGKRGQKNGFGKPDHESVTGYFLKKFVHYENVIGSGEGEYSINDYFFPILRLSDLYLLYAEALNESKGPSDEVFKYLNLIRENAGLESVQSSWSNYSINPGKFESKEGLREIIQRERLLELAFEGQRFWDLRRWKTAQRDLNIDIRGWDILQEEATAYYRPSTIFVKHFGLKDYFFPIRESVIDNNLNLVQNLGW